MAVGAVAAVAVALVAAAVAVALIVAAVAAALLLVQPRL